jgi:hypothetical protein
MPSSSSSFHKQGVSNACWTPRFYLSFTLHPKEYRFRGATSGFRVIVVNVNDNRKNIMCFDYGTHPLNGIFYYLFGAQYESSVHTTSSLTPACQPAHQI